MSGTHSLIFPLLYLLCGIVIFLLGLTLLRVGRSSAPTRAAALMLFFAGLGPLLGASGMILQHSLREGSVLFTSMLENFEYLWEFYFPSLLLFALTFPRENRALVRFPALGLLIFLPYVLHLMAFMFGDAMLDELTRLPRALAGAANSTRGSDIAISGFDAVVGAMVRLLESVHRALFAIVNIVYSVIALDLLWRSQNGLPNRRLIRQLRTVGIGVAASLACYALAKTSLMMGARVLPVSRSQAVLSLSLVASGGTIAYAVIRQQFLGVRHLLQRAVLYLLLAVLLGAIYLLAVRPVTSFFAEYSTVGQKAFEAGFVVLVVLAFQPVIERAELLLENAIVRSSGSTARRFKVLGDRVAAAGTFESLDEAVVKGLRDALDATDVRLTMLDAGDPLAVALAEAAEPVRRMELLRSPQPPRPSRFRRRARAAAQVAPRAPLDAEQLPPRVELFVPVMQEGHCVAYVALAEKVYGLAYGAEEMGHLSVLSTQIGAALLNIRLLKESVERKVFEEELRIARQIQMKMLPGQPPAVPGFGLYGVAVPSRQVGGDYYDFIVVDDRWLVVVVADVSGKGIPASLLTATLQATVRTGADVQTAPSRMLARLNRLIYQNTSASEFATAFYGVIDIEKGIMRYANAGHEFPFVVAGGKALQLEESGMVLGCIAEFDYTEHEVPMPEGSALVVFTDGVTDSESRAGENYGAERLRRLLESDGAASARDLCRRVIEDVRTFGDGENQDDLTLVVLTRGRGEA
jgi:serine phosphatase RsbU (regulator of sigma subunit)